MSDSPNPKLLFLACYFPPAAAIACVRAWNVAKHLAERGWEVTVVTPDPRLWRTVEEPELVESRLVENGVRRICTGYRMRYLAPGHIKVGSGMAGRVVGAIGWRAARALHIDDGAGWALAAERACAHLGPGDVDVIMATGSPFAAFGLAHTLSRRLGKPYVLDYRDAWTGNPHVARTASARHSARERHLLQNCAATTTVSESLGRDLDKRFDLGSKINVVSNGFDPEDMNEVQAAHFEPAAIVYAGDLYPPKRDITPLLRALAQLATYPELGPTRWRFHYYGNNGLEVLAVAASLGVEQLVVSHGHVTRAEALAAVKGASAAVVITTVADEGSLADKGIVTGKIFEAIGLGTPILVIAPPGSDVESIIKVAGGSARVAGSDTVGMAEFLREALLGRAPRQRQPEAYSWPQLVRQLDQVLRSVTERGTEL